MKHRAASKISDTDSAANAEYKAAMAQSALCQIHIEHFTRILALIDHAATLDVLDDLARLYPWAFATVSTVDTTTLTHAAARLLARTGINEMRVALHELDFRHQMPSPTTADDELLRKSKAVVDEDSALERLAEVRRQLHTFETALNGYPWASSFLQPPPFSNNKGDNQ